MDSLTSEKIARTMWPKWCWIQIVQQCRVNRYATGFHGLFSHCFSSIPRRPLFAPILSFNISARPQVTQNTQTSSAPESSRATGGCREVDGSGGNFIYLESLFLKDVKMWNNLGLDVLFQEQASSCSRRCWLWELHCISVWGPWCLGVGAFKGKSQSLQSYKRKWVEYLALISLGGR